MENSFYSFYSITSGSECHATYDWGLQGLQTCNELLRNRINI